MDYIFLSSIAGCVHHKIIVSYNISYQWGINFPCHTNALAVPPELHLPSPPPQIQYLIPKFHLEAHTVKCYIVMVMPAQF
jgi:hypothetical protein